MVFKICYKGRFFKAKEDELPLYNTYMYVYVKNRIQSVLILGEGCKVRQKELLRDIYL